MITSLWFTISQIYQCGSPLTTKQDLVLAFVADWCHRQDFTGNERNFDQAWNMSTLHPNVRIPHTSVFGFGSWSFHFCHNDAWYVCMNEHMHTHTCVLINISLDKFLLPAVMGGSPGNDSSGWRFSWPKLAHANVERIWIGYSNRQNKTWIHDSWSN